MSRPTHLTVTDAETSSEDIDLNIVFSALADPFRRRILERLQEEPLRVSELAEPFDISLQAVSRHIQVLVRAGLIEQQRSGRIARCSLSAGPLFAATVWLNRYSRHWQQQFETLAAWLDHLERPDESQEL